MPRSNTPPITLLFSPPAWGEGWAGPFGAGPAQTPSASRCADQAPSAASAGRPPAASPPHPRILPSHQPGAPRTSQLKPAPSASLSTDSTSALGGDLKPGAVGLEVEALHTRAPLLCLVPGSGVFLPRQAACRPPCTSHHIRACVPPQPLPLGTPCSLPTSSPLLLLDRFSLSLSSPLRCLCV